MTRADLELEIRNCLGRLSERDVDTVPMDAELGEAIGLDSLGRLELLSEVEDRLDITIYDVDSDKASTIGGMIDIVEHARLQGSEVV